MDVDAGNWLTRLGFAMLTCNSMLAIYHSKGDPWSIILVVSAYSALLLLFRCLRLYERITGPNDAQRGKLKAQIWCLTTFLTIMFSYKVVALMPSPVALVVWGMAAATILGGFYAFFIYNDR